MLKEYKHFLFFSISLFGAILCVVVNLIVMLEEGSYSPLINPKGRNPSVFGAIKSYLSLPKVSDWITIGLIIVCVVATIVLICV